MKKFYKIMFLNMMIFSTLISISAYSWFSMWIGLEINLLSFLPLLKSHKNLYPSEAALKYFIVQILSSSIILFTFTFSLNLMELFPSNSWYWISMMMNSAFLTKLGAAPFHFWFPEVAEGLNWISNLILLTWQKLAPMILIMYNVNLTFFFMMIILMSAIISGILGINQISLRKIMTYSSINHIAWMLASMMNLKNIWMFYFLIYSVISLMIILIFNLLNIYNLIQINLMMNYKKLVKIFLIMNFFSLSGLPPFLGFLPKWLTINWLIYGNFYFLTFTLILFTLIPMYFYIRIMMFSLMIYTNEFFFKTKNLNKITLITMNTISLLSLILCTNIMNL